MLPMVILPTPTRPMLVGDSLAYMMLPHVPDFDVFAFGGTNALQWRTKPWLARAITKYHPEILLACLGTNDVGVRAIFDKFPENVDVIDKRARWLGVERVVWLVPPNSRGPRVAEALDKAGVEVCPAPEGVELYPNDVHPTPRGYSTWSEHVRSFIA